MRFTRCSYAACVLIAIAKARPHKAPEGYIELPSNTHTGFVILRSNIKSGNEAEIAAVTAYGKRVKFYPLSQAANPGEPPETKYDRGPCIHHSGRL
jgi:hypothetical protein